MACPNNVKQPQCAPLLIKGFPTIPKGACMGGHIEISQLIPMPPSFHPIPRSCPYHMVVGLITYALRSP